MAVISFIYESGIQRWVFAFMRFLHPILGSSGVGLSGKIELGFPDNEAPLLPSVLCADPHTGQLSSARGFSRHH